MTYNGRCCNGFGKPIGDFVFEVTEEKYKYKRGFRHFHEQQ